MHNHIHIHLRHGHTSGNVNHIDMLEGKILPKIILFAIPLAISGMLQMLFNAVDSATVGQFVSSNALAAVGTDSQVISLLVNLMLGVSTGATVVVATAMGSGRTQGVHNAVHTTYLFAVVGGLVLAVAGNLLSEPILQVLSTPSDVIADAEMYLRIYCMGLPFEMTYNFVSAILRSVGDTRRPLYALVASGLLNVVLNLLFVCVFHWDVAGVAIATVMANALAAVLVTVFLMHEEDDLKLNLRKLRFHGPSLARILRIGIPTGLQGVLFTFSNVCIQSGINSCGPHAMAGSSAALIFEQLNFAVVTSFVQAGITFTSQNYAAGKRARCTRIARTTIACCFVTVLVVVGIFIGFRGTFIGLFTTDVDAVFYADYRIVHVLGLGWILAFYEVPGGLMRGYGYSLTPSVIAVFGTCVLRLVWLFVVFPMQPTFQFLMIAYPLSWVVTAAATVTAYFVVKNRAWKKHAAVDEKIAA